ncbi:MAG: hypothetical protein HYW49_07750 [Deltaproteobacteria bacterium]|nr:hypothetical protein [Deltaproteobacteria bacterium]
MKPYNTAAVPKQSVRILCSFAGWQWNRLGCYNLAMNANNTPKTETKRPPFYRRRYLIMPAFQLRLIFWNMGIILGIFAIVLVVIARSMGEMVDMGNEAGLPASHPYFQFAHDLARNFYIYFSGAFVVGIVLACTVTLLVSHRLAGPIFRLRKYFDGLSTGGPVSELRFRKNDFLQDFAPVVNATLKRVKD